MTSHIYMLVGAKVCDLTEDLLWFVCGNFDVFPKYPMVTSHGDRTAVMSLPVLGFLVTSSDDQYTMS